LELKTHADCSSHIEISDEISSSFIAITRPEHLPKKLKKKKTNKVDESDVVRRSDPELKKQKKKKGGKLTNHAADGGNSKPPEATSVDIAIGSSADSTPEPPAKKQKKKKTSKVDKYAAVEGGGDEQPNVNAASMDIALGLGSTSSALVSQFQEIRREIQISNEQYNFALDLMSKLEQAFRLKFPSCKVYFLRHYYLKLRTVAGDHLLFYLDVEGSIGRYKNEFYQ